MIPPLVEVRGLSYRYDDGTEALRGVDFTLQAGETVALIGPNGSGKTTFVLHLNGLLQGAGEATICGLAVNADNLRQIRQKVGIVFQDSDDQLFMPTILEDVAFGLLNRGIPAAEAAHRALHALEHVGMAGLEKKAPYHLSAGQKKRVAIAGILVTEPEILILDEPTTYLDPPGRAALLELLRALPQAKILVTHDVPFAAALASRAVFFRDGLIAGEGTVSDVVRCFHWS